MYSAAPTLAGMFAARLRFRAVTILGAVGYLVLSALLPATAAEFEDLPSDYIVQNWTVENGLPQSSVTKIVQTPDGYLWLATYNGLARFDGVRMTVFHIGNTPELKANSIEALFLDHSGRLTIVSEGGDGVWYERGRFSRCQGIKGLPDGPLAFRGEPPVGGLHFNSRDLTAMYAENSAGQFAETAFDTVSPNLTADCRLAADAGGGLWYEDGGVWKHLPQDHWKSLPSGPAGPCDFRTVGPSLRTGASWMVSNGGIALRDGREWRRYYPSTIPIGDCASIAEDHDGVIWIGTWRQGLWRVSPDGAYHRYLITRGREPEAIRSLFVDREGNVWLGADASGLFRLRRRLFQTIASPEGLHGEVVKSVTEDGKGQIWAANQAGFEAIDPSRGPAGAAVRLVPHELGWCVYCDRSGKLWMGNYHGNLYSWNADALVEARAPDSNLINPITAMTEDSSGQLWVGTSITTSGRLWRVSEGKRIQEPLPEFYAKSGIRALVVDHRGGIWAGLTGGGLLHREASHWLRADPPGVLPDGRVSALAVDRDGAVWVGTPGSGLFRLYDNAFYRFDPDQTGLPRVVASITEDDEGYLWMGSTDGIYRMKRSDLNRWAEGKKVEARPSRYNRSDGLGTSECAMNVQPAVWKARDGRLWFATRKGLAVVSPKDIKPDMQPPPVLIEEAILWGDPKQTVSLGTPADSGPPRLRVSASTRLLEIHYTAPSFSAPERVKFRYRLDADPDWTEAGGRRVAYYQGLSPGGYRFLVSACNLDGEWNEGGAALSFIIEPHAWQTWWFRSAAIALAAALGGLAYHLRVERLTAINRLRLRIAGDLHDEIGANLGSISLNAQLLERNPALADAAREEVGGLRRVAAQTGQAVRDLVWFTNPDFDNTTDMIRRMKEVLALQLPGRDRRFEAGSVELGRPLSPEFRRNVFLIYKEALHNVAKHSGATRVEVGLQETEDGLKMTVADNGCGCASDAPEGHGLGSMRRRAAELGGSVVVESQPGKGVTVTLLAPFGRPARFWPRTPRIRGGKFGVTRAN